MPVIALLTPREREVSTLIAAGLSTKAAARILRVSPKTISYHLASVFRKLHVQNRYALRRRCGSLAPSRELSRQISATLQQVAEAAE
jgi:DNA-binding CsgD family transcriptional regulator